MPAYKWNMAASTARASKLGKGQASKPAPWATYMSLTNAVSRPNAPVCTCAAALDYEAWPDTNSGNDGATQAGCHAGLIIAWMAVSSRF